MSPILQPGITSQGSVRELARAESSFRISHAARLVDLQDEFVCFTPALLYALLPLNGRDPLAEFVTLTGKPAPYWLNLPVRLLTGLREEFRDWHGRVGLYPLADWPALRQHFGRALYTDSESGLVARVRWQQVAVADPIAQARATHLPADGWPSVRLHSISLVTNQYRAYITDGAFTYDYDVAPSEALFANAIKKHHDDPYGFVEQTVERHTGQTPEEQRLENAPHIPYIQEQTAIAKQRLLDQLKQELPDGDPSYLPVSDAGI